MKDTLYLHDFGPDYGSSLFMLSSMLSLRVWKQHQLRMTWGNLAILLILAASPLFWDPVQQQPAFIGHAHSPVEANFDEGLYYNTQNQLVRRIASLWEPSTRQYSPANGATRWMATGDVRTGLPFFLNKVDYNPAWTRVWLTTTTHDKEVLALDIAFPKTGHDFTKPVYMVLHGLNGGSNEGYVKDLTMRRNMQGSTVIVMVARGMMGEWRHS